MGAGLLRGDILASFYSYEEGAQFSHYYISKLGETLSYNGLKKIGLISLKSSFLFGHLPADFKQQISSGSSCNLVKDVAVSINTT